MLVSRALVNVVIDQQIGQQISVWFYLLFYFLCPVQLGSQVDTISEVLQRRCGSFCSTNDVMLYKVCFFNTLHRTSLKFDSQAKENIRKAVETRNIAERQQWLSESLR